MGLLLAAALAGPVDGAQVPVLDVLQEELERSLSVLGEQDPPAYFLSYEITSERVLSIAASFGAATGQSVRDRQYVDIVVRVGDHEFDNTHPVRGARGARPQFAPLSVPVSDVEGLRKALWFHTDRKYKEAIEQLTRVKTNVQVTAQEESEVPDFSPEAPERFTEDRPPLVIDGTGWAERLERYTEPFAGSDHVLSATASVSISEVTRWFVNSEGAAIRTVQPAARLYVVGVAKAEDGMDLPRFESFFAFAPEGLPDEAEVMETVSGMIRDLEALRDAPLADPYTGPAVLSGRASGVFFHEILGHRVEGHRQRSDEDAQTFGKMLGESVLPEAFSVYFDPTVRQVGEIDLAGSYRYDNQGVRARRVGVIEDGMLRRFLMSRTPIEGFSRSNGHGRKQPGFASVARQSNLLVEVAETRSLDELKQLLVERLREQGKEYGLLFDDIQGGFTFTGRSMPNAFNVMPIMVYRIYPDGREELVRGVDLIGTPLATFSQIVAAGGETEVFNGICGAESGGVPVSAASPSILVAQVEVQKKAKSQERLPLLPSPPRDAPQSAQAARSVR